MRDTVAGCVAKFGGQARVPRGAGLSARSRSAGAAGKLAVQAPTASSTPARAGPAAARARCDGSTSHRRFDRRRPEPHRGGRRRRRLPHRLPVRPGPARIASSLNYNGAAPVGGGVTVGVDAQGDVCICSLRHHPPRRRRPGHLPRRAGSLGFTGNTPSRLVDSRTLGARVGTGLAARGRRRRRRGVAEPHRRRCHRLGLPDRLPVRRDDALRVERQLPPRPPGRRQRRHGHGQRRAKVCILASVATHVVVDLAGRFGAGGSSFVPAAPTRVLDTRPGIGGWQGSASFRQARSPST